MIAFAEATRSEPSIGYDLLPSDEPFLVVLMDSQSRSEKRQLEHWSG